MRPPCGLSARFVRCSCVLLGGLVFVSAFFAFPQGGIR